MGLFEDLSNQWQNNVLGSNPQSKTNYASQWNDWEQQAKPIMNKYLKDLGINADYDTVTAEQIKANARHDPKILDYIYRRDTERTFGNMAKTAPQLQQSALGIQRQVTDFRNQFAPSSQQPFSPTVTLSGY